MAFRPPVVVLRDALKYVEQAQRAYLAAQEYTHGLDAATVASELRLLIELQEKGDDDTHAHGEPLPTDSDHPDA